MISQALIQELKQILKEEYGADLTMEQVSEIANGQVAYYRTLAEIYIRDKQKIDSS